MNERFLQEARELEARWASLSLLPARTDGRPLLEGERLTNETAAVLLENQRLLTAASEPDQEIAQFRRISIPLVRRIYPRLIADNIVGVQPLTGPTGLVYYLRFQYSQNSGGVRPARGSYYEKPQKVDWKTEGF